MKFSEYKGVITIIYTNLLIGLFNLIPIYPLDGGRVAEAVLECFLNKELVKKMVHEITNISIITISIIAIIGAIYLMNGAIILILTYLWGIVIIENRKYKIRKRVYQILKKDKQVSI